MEIFLSFLIFPRCVHSCLYSVIQFTSISKHPFLDILHPKALLAFRPEVLLLLLFSKLHHICLPELHLQNSIQSIGPQSALSSGRPVHSAWKHSSHAAIAASITEVNSIGINALPCPSLPSPSLTKYWMNTF